VSVLRWVFPSDDSNDLGRAFRPFDIYEKGSEASWIASDHGAAQSGSFNASAEGSRYVGSISSSKIQDGRSLHLSGRRSHVDGRSSFESTDVREPARFSTPRSRQSMKVDPDLARRIIHEEPKYDPDVWSSMSSGWSYPLLRSSFLVSYHCVVEAYPQPLF
jgi:hypothetical protein